MEKANNTMIRRWIHSSTQKTFSPPLCMNALTQYTPIVFPYINATDVIMIYSWPHQSESQKLNIVTFFLELCRLTDHYY